MKIFFLMEYLMNFCESQQSDIQENETIQNYKCTIHIARE